MSNSIYIKDSYGHDIPLMDDYGNLSMQVIMLYSEDKLTAEDRKKIEDVAAQDEMSKDALEGYALTGNASKTRYTIGELNGAIQKASGAAPLTSYSPNQQQQFDYRKIAAGIAALIVLGTGTYFIANEFLSKDPLAETTKTSLPQEEENRNRNQTKVQAAEEEPVILNDVLDENAESEASNSANIIEKKTEADKADEAIKQTSDITEPKEKLTKKVEIQPVADKLQVEETPPGVDSDGLAANIAINDNEQVLSEKVVLVADETNDEQAEEKEAIQQELELAASRNRNSESQAKNERIETAEKIVKQKAVGAASNALASDDKAMMSSAARFPGGDIAMYKFIENRKVYSEAMQALNLSGSVTITFDIEADGRVVKAKVKSGINGLLNEDALRVVRSMPNWNPAKNDNGEPTKSSRSVVIKYGEN